VIRFAHPTDLYRVRGAFEVVDLADDAKDAEITAGHANAVGPGTRGAGPAGAPRMTESELRAIASRAADPPAGMRPADVIDQALREAGVPGDYSSNDEYRWLWNRAAGLTCDIFRERLAAMALANGATISQRPRRPAFRYNVAVSQAAYEVLRDAGQPLRLTEIHALLVQRGWTTLRLDTLGSALSRTPRIVRISRGVYVAADHAQERDESEQSR